MEGLSHSEFRDCHQCSYDAVCHAHLQMTLICGTGVLEYAKHIDKYCIKRPLRDSSLSGHQWIWELWHGHDDRFFQQMRMRKSMLRRLIETLVGMDGLPNAPKHITLEESMSIFLLVIGQGATYPVIEERLQRSSETVSNHFHMVLNAVCKFGAHMVTPIDRQFRQEAPEILANPFAWPYFKGCVGAIDGTHVNVHIPDSRKVPWVNRKGVTTTNILATCDFNMCITYAAVGMEGSMHDSRVLNESLRETRMPFPVPPEGKYYLADAGYPLAPGFLTPYRRTRYHLPEYRHNRNFRNSNELFNYRHSSLRSVIERTFGVLKKRWRVLHSMPLMNIKTELQITWACITIHNFIRRYDEDDITLLGRILDEDDALSFRLRDNVNAEWIATTSQQLKEMEAFHDRIRDSLLQ